MTNNGDPPMESKELFPESGRVFHHPLSGCHAGHSSTANQHPSVSQVTQFFKIERRASCAAIVTPSVRHSTEDSTLLSERGCRRSSCKHLRFHPSVLLWPMAEEGNVVELKKLLCLCKMLAPGRSDDGAKALSPYAIATDYNECNKDGLTLLHLCCFLGDRALDCVRLLVELGADPTQFDNRGWTPLQLARSRRHERVVSFLLRASRGAKGSW